MSASDICAALGVNRKHGRKSRRKEAADWCFPREARPIGTQLGDKDGRIAGVSKWVSGIRRRWDPLPWAPAIPPGIRP